MKFKKDFLINELDLPYNLDIIQEDNIRETSRWSALHEIIFEYNNKYYLTSYSEGLTEQQDESPWEYNDEVECVEVEQREVLVKQWVNCKTETQKIQRDHCKACIRQGILCSKSYLNKENN